MLPILLALAFIALLFVVIIAGRPDEFVVARSATIFAPPERVFPNINDLRLWEAWSPWAERDPNAKNSFAGPPAGAGAAMSWDGQKMGAGKMTIVESQPGGLVRIQLEFLRPFKATNMAKFRFNPEGNQTVVTWTMVGKNNFFFKAFGLFMNCEDMCGRDFEKGLVSLKAIAEKA